MSKGTEKTEKLTWDKSPSVRIMQAINGDDITKSYATKYPIESRFSDGQISDKDERILHDILNQEHVDEEKALNEHKEVLAKIYDAFQLKEKYSFFGSKEEKISTEYKAKIVLAFWDKYRTHFNREEERIICLNAFRRLQYKTQVMINSASDDQRTRLLHSMEVERAARKIAVAVGANYELVSVIALAHDIGHTPFGHAGERVIDEYLSEKMMGGFAHSLQGVKVLDKLCTHPKLREFGMEGIGLSKYVLEGVLKHDADSFVKDFSSPAFKLQYDCSELIKAVGCEKTDIRAPKEIQIGSVESQIIAWADKIEYIGHDWEECILFGLLDKMIGRINNIVIQMQTYTENDFLGTKEYNNSKNKGEILKKEDEDEKIEKKDEKQLEFEYFSNILERIGAGGKFFNKKMDADRWGKFYDEILSDVLGNLELLLGDDKNRLGGIPIKNPYFFSREQYHCLYDFFKITHAWVSLTNTYPKQSDMGFDLIYLFFDYLKKTTSHVITPKLTKCLINDSKQKIAEAIKDNKSRDDIISECNKQWSENKEKYPNDEKEALRLSFMVTFSEKNYQHIKTILAFTKEQYINSTRVRNMNIKAKKIINTLLNFYCDSPKMLPYAYRNRLSQEITNEKKYQTTDKLLVEYFSDIIESSKREIQKDIGKSLKEKFSFEKHDKNIRVDIVEKAITTRIVVDYVAGMTDRMAEMKYNEIVSSSTTWSIVYGE